MHFSILLSALFASFAYRINAVERRAPARIAVTDNILHLKTVPYASHLISPSSKHLQQSRSVFSKRQNDPIAILKEPLLTLGGRAYLTNVTISDRLYSLVIDTGSSDTWVASSTFRCLNPNTYATIDVRYCGFGTPFTPSESSRWKSIPGYNFSVNYTGGEFLSGQLGTDHLGIGDVGNGGGTGGLVIRQTIGVVDSGYWVGDGISSGLMGLAYPALVSGASTLKYQSIMFTLAQQSLEPDIFSLALSRSTPQSPNRGGQLAIGGILNVPHDNNWITVPIVPVAQDVYAYYSVKIDGFYIEAPRSPSIMATSPNQSNTPGRLHPVVSHTHAHSSNTSSSSTKRGKPNTGNTKRDVYDYPSTMILDSGSSLLYFPDHITNYIASLFTPPAVYNADYGNYIVSCTAAAPRIGVAIGGKTFFIHEDDLMNRGPGAVGGPGVGAGRGQCVLAAQRAGQGSLVLGDTWLKGVLVVFDVGANQVRIAGRENY